jgi:putative phosphoribosyl transferase
MQVRDVTIAEDGVALGGILAIPESPRGIVIFAHGSGSSRFSPRNQQVARTLNAAGLETLLFDLLTPQESGDRKNVFDIPLLGRRLELAARWARTQEAARNLPVGYFGASTGAGAALWAASESRIKISAVVSRGGRPDLAGERLAKVEAPTLLLVGSHDEQVISLNRLALRQLRNAKLAIVPGATHLFEEPGTLEIVEEEAVAWFLTHFKKEAVNDVA